MIATVLWVLAGAASLLLVLFVPMLFDAPGSNTNPATLGFAASIVVFPVACLASIVGSWIAFAKRRLRTAVRFTLLPLLPVATACLAMVAHEEVFAGRLGG